MNYDGNNNKKDKVNKETNDKLMTNNLFHGSHDILYSQHHDTVNSNDDGSNDEKDDVDDTISSKDITNNLFDSSIDVLHVQDDIVNKHKDEKNDEKMK